MIKFKKYIKRSLILIIMVALMGDVHGSTAFANEGYEVSCKKAISKIALESNEKKAMTKSNLSRNQSSGSCKKEKIGKDFFNHRIILIDQPHQPPKESTEELYQDVYLALLMPYIQSEVEKYYSNTMSQAPLVDLYSIYITSISRPHGYRSFVFDINLQVNPYIGPHITIGTDNIELTVEGSGKVDVKSFKHIKSYDLPPNYEHIITEMV